MGCLNYAIFIVVNELIITQYLILLEVYQWTLSVLTFGQAKLIWRVWTLLVVGIKRYQAAASRILIGKRSACFLPIEANLLRVYSHLLNNYIGISSCQKLLCKFRIALEIYISALASLTFNVQARQEPALSLCLKWLEIRLALFNVTIKESLVRKSLRHPCSANLSLFHCTYFRRE
jgi:hypothetical protein